MTQKLPDSQAQWASLSDDEFSAIVKSPELFNQLQMAARSVTESQFSGTIGLSLDDLKTDATLDLAPFPNPKDFFNKLKSLSTSHALRIEHPQTKQTPHESLRLLAMARLVLPQKTKLVLNPENWGAKMAQISLFSGITHFAPLSAESLKIIAKITLECGLTPQLVNSDFVTNSNAEFQNMIKTIKSELRYVST